MTDRHRVARAILLAGVLSGAPSTLHALLTGGDPLAATRAAGTLLPGRRDRPGIVAGGIAHGVLTLWWVGVLAAASRGRRLGPWRGALAGAGIAALDLGVIAPRRAPAIARAAPGTPVGRSPRVRCSGRRVPLRHDPPSHRRRAAG